MWYPMFAIGVSVLFGKLAMMQTEGLLAFGGVFITSSFAMTSLMYARARAVSAPEEANKRADIADECLRLTFLAILGYIVTAFIFLGLSENHCQRAGHFLDQSGKGAETAPLIAAWACSFFFAVPIFIKIRIIIAKTIENMGLMPGE